MRDEQLSHLEQVPWEKSILKKKKAIYTLSYVFPALLPDTLVLLSITLAAASAKHSKLQVPMKSFKFLHLCCLYYHSACPAWAQGSAGPPFHWFPRNISFHFSITQRTGWYFLPAFGCKWLGAMQRGASKHAGLAPQHQTSQRKEEMKPQKVF